MLNKILKCIAEELIDFNNHLDNTLSTSLIEYQKVLDYTLQNKGKQIRPIIGILTAKMLGEFSQKQNEFLQAIELIHNATLFHDDVIDNSLIRRNKPTLQEEFSNKIAILSGDYFLSSALICISKIQNNKINSLLANCIKKVCEGELEQNLTLYEIPSLEKYLNKTKNKTALLFELTMEGIALLSENKSAQKGFKNIGEYIGMIFQINDDSKNFQNYKDKPILNDLKNGVLTAPIIFLSEEYPQIQELIEKQNYDEILSLLNQSNAIFKTKDLINQYKLKSTEILNKYPDSEYKKLLLDLLSEMCK